MNTLKNRRLTSFMLGVLVGAVAMSLYTGDELTEKKLDRVLDAGEKAEIWYEKAEDHLFDDSTTTPRNLRLRV